MTTTATPPGITEAAYQQLTDEQKRQLGYQRPLSDAEFAQLTPEQMQNLGLAPKVQGAPADFGGTVYPNPDNIHDSWDTDAPPTTRLPTGVSFQQQNATGKMPADTSNPPAAQLGAPGSTVQANFSPQASAWTPVDETAAKWAPVQESAPEVPSTWQVLKGDTGEIPLTSTENADRSALQSIVQGFRGTAKGMWDQLTTPPKDTIEKAISGMGPTLLPLYRTLVGAGHTVQEATQIVGAVHDINSSSDPAGAYAKAMQETAGQGAAQALTALATEGVIKVAPKVIDTVGNAAKMTAPVRATVKAANTVLQEAPEVVGGAAGASVGGTIGHYVGAPGVGAELGGAAGYRLGQKFLPKVTIPGEGFGLPNRVSGGPETAPPYRVPAEPPPVPAPKAQPATRHFASESR